MNKYTKQRPHLLACFLTHSLTVSSYYCLLVLYSLAASPLSGSLTLASDSKLLIDNKTLLIVSMGLHSFFRMSRQIEPSVLIFGWNTFVSNLTLGGLNG